MARLISCLIGLLLCGLITGCAYATRASQHTALEPYSQAKAKIPPQPADSLRLIIFRPQMMTGLFASHIVIIDGKWMGDQKDPFNDNLLLPSAVFVVDVPARLTRIWAFAPGVGEERERAIELRPTDSHARYLRWTMRPTHGYLQEVGEQQALLELETLRLSGYRNLTKD
jgi:hypothetical protein